ncbi:RNA-directed DNA polymerase, eukaryota [Tanacetum coccineum]
MLTREGVSGVMRMIDLVRLSMLLVLRCFDRFIVYSGLVNVCLKSISALCLDVIVDHRPYSFEGSSSGFGLTPFSRLPDLFSRVVEDGLFKSGERIGCAVLEHSFSLSLVVTIGSVMSRKSALGWFGEQTPSPVILRKVLRKGVEDYGIYPLVSSSSVLILRIEKISWVLDNVLYVSITERWLPTRVNLSRRGVLLDSHLCPLCNAAMEDVQHVFFRCDVARVVLRKICRWWDIWNWLGDLIFLGLGWLEFLCQTTPTEFWCHDISGAKLHFADVTPLLEFGIKSLAPRLPALLKTF